MLLRRVVEHVKTQNWFAVAIDFLIVVIGVFMGLQVQEWNQQRTDRGNELAYLERLSADFATIDRDLQHCLSVYSDSIAAINLISQVVEDQAASGPNSNADRDTISTALIRMTAGAIPAGRSATFIEMLSIGDLSILRDATLRDALVAYDERAQISREVWRSTREEAIAYGRPLYDNIKLSVDLEKRRISSIHDYDLIAMSSDPDFQSMLNVLVATKGNNYELCQAQRNLANGVQLSLEQQH